MTYQTRESSELSLFVYPDETLDDLQRGGLLIIQKKNGFRMGEDSVLLAAFAAGQVNPQRRLTKTLRVADIGAGSGAVSLLLSSRLPTSEVTGIEISHRPHDVFLRNIKLNQLGERVKAVLGDVRQIDLLPRAQWDLVVSNPPYRDSGRHIARTQSGDPDLDNELLTALAMATLTPDDLCKTAAAWLKPGGTLALIQRPENLPLLLAAMQSHRITPTVLRPVVPLPGRKPSAILLAGRLHGKPNSFRLDPELLVCDRPGHYSPEAAAIYGVSSDD